MGRGFDGTGGKTSARARPVAIGAAKGARPSSSFGSRGCTYEDVANVMVFLASDASSYMTGQALNVTGGQEMH